MPKVRMQYRKCNVLNVFSIGIKEWSTAPADNSWHNAQAEWCVSHHIGSSVCTCASPHIHGHSWWAVDWSSVLSLFLALFLSRVCLLHLVFLFPHLLFFHVDNAKANITCASANWGVLPPGRIHRSHTGRTPGARPNSRLSTIFPYTLP